MSWARPDPAEREQYERLDCEQEDLKTLAVSQGYLSSGDRLVITAGTPMGTKGATNLIKADYIP